MGCGASTEKSEQRSDAGQKQQEQPRDAQNNAQNNATKDADDKTTGKPDANKDQQSTSPASPAPATQQQQQPPPQPSAQPSPGFTAAAAAQSPTAAASAPIVSLAGVQDFVVPAAPKQRRAKTGVEDDEGDQSTSGENTVTTSLWTSNEKYMLTTDGGGGVACLSAFVPYKPLWRRLVPRQMKRMSSPVPIAVMAPHNCDMTGVLVVDSHGHLWRFDTATGVSLHLACMLPEGTRPSPTAGALCATAVPLPKAANPACPEAGPIVNMLVVAGLKQGAVVGKIISFQPLAVVKPSVRVGAGGGAAAAPQPAPAYNVQHAFAVTKLCDGTDITGIDAAQPSATSTLTADTNAVASGDEVSKPITLIAGGLDGDLASIRHRGGFVAVKGSTSGDAASASFEVEATALKQRVVNGLHTLRALLLLPSGDGAAASDAQLRDATVALMTLDMAGAVALWRVPPTPAAESADGDEWPVAQRRIDATSLCVSQDWRYALCGVQRLPDDVLRLLGDRAPAKGQGAQYDIAVLNLGAALEAMANDSRTNAASGSSKSIGLANETPLLLPTLLHSDTLAEARTVVTSISQSTNRVLLLACTAAGAAIMVDFSAYVKPERLLHHRGYTVASLAVCNSKFGVSASEDTTLRAWELLSGRPLCVLDAHVGRVWSVTPLRGFGLTPVARRASIDDAQLGADTLPQRQQHATERLGVRRASGAAAAMANWVVSGSEDGTLRVWALPSGRLIETHSTDGECVWSLASEDGFIAAGLDNGTIRLFCLVDDVEGKMRDRRSTRKERPSVVEQLAAEADAQKKEGPAADGDAKPPEQQPQRKQKKGAEEEKPFEAPPADSVVHYGGRAGAVNAALERRKQQQPEAAQPGAAKQRFAACGKLLGHKSAVTALHAVSYTLAAPSTTADAAVPLLISGSQDSTVRLWDMATEACLYIFTGHTDVVWALSSNAPFHPSVRNPPRVSGDPTATPHDRSPGTRTPARKSPSPPPDPLKPPPAGDGAAAPSTATTANDSVRNHGIPPMIIYSGSQDGSLRAWAAYIDEAVEVADSIAEAESAASGADKKNQAGAPSPVAADAAADVGSSLATADIGNPVASVAVIEAMHVATGSAAGGLRVHRLVLTDSAGSSSAPPGGNAAKYVSKNPARLRIELEVPGVHEGGSSLCALTSSRYCILTGGVDGVVKYHETWPGLQSEAAKTDAERAAALREHQRARLVLARMATAAAA